jgi:hypothetical protein
MNADTMHVWHFISIFGDMCYILVAPDAGGIGGDNGGGKNRMAL